jgi:hypothetical protein
MRIAGDQFSRILSEAQTRWYMVAKSSTSRNGRGKWGTRFFIQAGDMGYDGIR